MNEGDAVRDWLARTGYPLEAEVARSFRAAGFEVVQGLHYRADGPEATGGREVDVLAVREQLVSRHPITRCTVLFVIESKVTSVPWVVFRGRSSATAWEAVGHFPTNAVNDLNILGALEIGDDPWLLRLPANVSYGVHALATKQRQPSSAEPSRAERKQMMGIGNSKEASWDQAHSAVKQAVSAAQGVLRDDPPHLPTLAVPVIVVGSRLYAVSYDDDGREDVSLTNWERILWRGNRSGEPIAIDVVSREFLDDYAKLAADGAEELLPILRGAALDAREDAFSRQDPPGRVDSIVAVLESARDVASPLVERARRSWARVRG